MTTDRTLEFRNNQAMFQPELVAQQPDIQGLPHIKNAFNQNANRNQGITLQQALNPQEPITVPSQEGLKEKQNNVINSIHAPGLLPEAVPIIQKMQESDISTMGKGVAGVAMEAAGALFGSLRDKSKDMEPAPEDMERKLAMTMQPKPPTQSFGMGVGGGLG